MQLDAETAKTIMAASAQCNAVAEEAARRVVDLMQQAIDHRERIAELEAALLDAAEKLERGHMPDYVARTIRTALGPDHN